MEATRTMAPRCTVSAACPAEDGHAWICGHNIQLRARMDEALRIRARKGR